MRKNFNEMCSKTEGKCTFCDIKLSRSELCDHECRQGLVVKLDGQKSSIKQTERSFKEMKSYVTGLFDGLKKEIKSR